MMSLFNYDTIVVTVERPNGTTFEQKVHLKENETGEQASKRYQKALGEPWGWYTERGRKFKYLKKGAYIVTDWRYE